MSNTQVTTTATPPTAAPLDARHIPVELIDRDPDQPRRRFGFGMRIPALFFVLAMALMACAPASPAELNAAVSVLVEQGAELTPGDLDRETVEVVLALKGNYKSPYELPSGRKVAWTVKRELAGIWYLPYTVDKRTMLIPQYVFEWEYVLTIFDEYDREIFHREVRVE